MSNLRSVTTLLYCSAQGVVRLELLERYCTFSAGGETFIWNLLMSSFWNGSSQIRSPSWPQVLHIIFTWGHRHSLSSETSPPDSPAFSAATKYIPWHVFSWCKSHIATYVYYQEKMVYVAAVHCKSVSHHIHKTKKPGYVLGVVLCEQHIYSSERHHKHSEI